MSFFNQLGVEVVGADISANAILRARRINPSTRPVAASAEEALPFASGSFDVVSGETPAHVFDGHNALSNLIACSSPAGI